MRLPFLYDKSVSEKVTLGQKLKECEEQSFGSTCVLGRGHGMSKGLSGPCLVLEEQEALRLEEGGGGMRRFFNFFSLIKNEHATQFSH